MASEFEDATTVAAAGTTLTYREQGSGEPVVFVHGDLSDLRTWEAQLAGLGATHRAIAYSRRYARPNEDIPPGVDNPLVPHADDLAAFLQAIDAAPAHLVGNSLGAFIALLTAMRHPHAVRSLTLNEPPVLTLLVSMPPRPAEMLRLFGRRPRTAIAIARFGATAMGPAQKRFSRDDDEAAVLAFAGGVLGRERYEALPEARRQQAWENRSTLKAGLLGDGFPPLATDELRRLTTPTLLVTGEHTPAFFVRLSDHLEEALPATERVEVAGASHMPHEEAPEAFNEAVLAFLRGRAAAV